MRKVNIKKIYGIDEYVELSDTIFRALEKMDKYEHALTERDRYNRVHLTAYIELAQPSGQLPFDETLVARLHVHALLMDLSSKQRRRVILRYIHGYSIKEIAIIEGTNSSAISQSLKAAKEYFRNNFIE